MSADDDLGYTAVSAYGVAPTVGPYHPQSPKPSPFQPIPRPTSPPRLWSFAPEGLTTRDEATIRLFEVIYREQAVKNVEEAMKEAKVAIKVLYP